MPLFNQEVKQKGDKPILRGTNQNVDGVERIALWSTPEFEELLEKVVRKVAKE